MENDGAMLEDVGILLLIGLPSFDPLLAILTSCKSDIARHLQ